MLQRSKPSTANVEGGLQSMVEDGKMQVPTLSTLMERVSQKGPENEKIKKRREIPLLSMRLRSSDPSPPAPAAPAAVAGVVTSSESPLSALLQPIFALFPPAQPAPPPTSTTPTPGLAPAFDLKPPSPTKEKPNADTKAKPLVGDDNDEFVIYQPSSWTAKRKKPSAATLAYMLDWRTDPFGDSPVAVRGQRTKYPKQTALPLPPIKTKTPIVNRRTAPARKVKVPIPLDFGLQLGRREHWGSLASVVSEVSFTSSSFSLGSGESSNSSSNFHEQQLVTPLQDEFDYYGGIMQMVETDMETELPYLNNHHRGDESDDLAASLGIDLTTSPTRPLRDGLARLQVQSPMADLVPSDIVEEEEEQMDSPHTPLTPRSVPSDEDSDSD